MVQGLGFYRSGLRVPGLGVQGLGRGALLNRMDLPWAYFRSVF